MSIPTVNPFTTPNVTAPGMPDAHDAALLRCTHVIATVQTRNSRYTIVKRKGVVVVTKDGDATSPRYVSPVETGTVMVGTELTVVASLAEPFPTYVVCLWDEQGRVVFRSSTLTSVYVLEN